MTEVTAGVVLPGTRGGGDTRAWAVRPSDALGVVALIVAAGCLATVVAVLRHADPNGMNGLGLVGALPPMALGSFAGLAALLGLVLALRSVPQWGRLGVLLVLVVSLDLAPLLLEPLPHFATAWVHAGYADYIARTGHILRAADARFSWPGFFGAAGLLAHAIGVSPLTLARWTPVVLDLLVLLPVSALLRTFVADPRQRAIGLTVFVLGDWVGQTYFAPQGVNYLLFLVSLLLVLRLLSAAGGGRGALLVSRLLRRREEGDSLVATAPDQTARVVALLVVVVLMAAVVVSHQLTPFFVLLALGALVVLGVSRLSWLVVLCAAMILGYFVWGAQDFWIGHLQGLVDDLGSFGHTVRLTVVDRASHGPDLQRRLVLDSRLIVPLLIAVLAVVGLVRNRSRVLVTPAVLAVVPLLVLGLQSYGGESALRIYLFMLPWLAVLAAHAAGAGRRRRSTSAVSLLLLPVLVVAGLGLFGLARYGNEQFERMQPRDHDAVDYAYAHAQRGAGLYALAESVPWRDHDIERVHFSYAARLPLDRAELDAFVDTIAAEPVPSLLIVTDSQWRELHELAGLSDAQVRQLQSLVQTSPRLEALWVDGDVGVYGVRRGTS